MKGNIGPYVKKVHEIDENKFMEEAMTKAREELEKAKAKLASSQNYGTDFNKKLVEIVEMQHIMNKKNLILQITNLIMVIFIFIFLIVIVVLK